MAEINVGTVMTMIEIIDMAAKKGTFHGADLSVVGATRAELMEIIQPLVEAEKKAEDDRRALEAAEAAQREYEESMRKTKVSEK